MTGHLEQGRVLILDAAADAVHNDASLTVLAQSGAHARLLGLVQDVARVLVGVLHVGNMARRAVQQDRAPELVRRQVHNL